MDEKTIIDILVKRSNEQRQQIKEAYQQSSGKVRPVMDDLGHTRGQHFLRMCSLVVASGIGTKERPEGRPGGCGAGPVEDPGPV